MLFTRTRLAFQDKNIIKSLKHSEFIASFSDESLNEFKIDDLNHSEKWLEEIKLFISIAIKRAKYREPFRKFGYNFDDMYFAYILMTLATVPNPICKTGKHNLTVSSIGSCMYQEKNLFKAFLTDLRTNSELYHEDPLKLTSINLGKSIKIIHDQRYGEIKFNEIPY